MGRGQNEFPHGITRCQGGCFHLLWGQVTLHLSEEEFRLLASLVVSTHRELVEESDIAAAAVVETGGSLLM